ncbi:ParB/RepB/Spo0J family partition protein [Pokkaliibacter sp. MBI-7]|uniref:ParB/RepB/Spo0J family partition protein n=1 Tax=Pokkaliibacter sp. MBI-7 TaxID=3040600 RepID=UPI00244A7A5D|nr:ParB/RepB/Spo0J family partition protein [Pokkaliibacter sp. MBI-7]MDH2433095.1 ParB/RepB/Spo0J family partition protein [Pokkaliibacter sp. MBI-7]
MSTKKRGLGRGLDALLGAGRQPVSVSSIDEPTIESWLSEPQGGDSEEQTEPSAVPTLRFLDVALIIPGMAQPRQVIEPESLEQLAASIRQQGVMQPVVVRPQGDKFELIAGERRWRASQLAGLDKVPALVRQVSDADALVLALVENIQREDLNPLEQARALQRLQESSQLTQQEVADIVGKSRSAVANLLRLLSLEDSVKLRLEHGDLEMGHARALLALTSADQMMAAEEVVARGLSVRQTEALVRKLLTPVPEQAAKMTAAEPWIESHQSRLQRLFGDSVSIRHSARGSGKLIIEYKDVEQLEKILNQVAPE